VLPITERLVHPARSSMLVRERFEGEKERRNGLLELLHVKVKPFQMLIEQAD
jgi:hypothetical protein